MFESKELFARGAISNSNRQLSNIRLRLFGKLELLL